MWLEEIQIRNFRNYRSENLLLGRGLNVLVGPNGAGKTNFLEAVGLLSHGRSMRLRNVSDLVRQDSGAASLAGRFRSGNGAPISVRCVLDRKKGKRIRVNGKSVKRLSDVFRLVPTVQCFEEDTFLVSGSPSLRRNFIDCLCAQLYPEYLQLHKKFREALKQRNAALKKGMLVGELKEAANGVYARSAAPIVSLRNSALVKLMRTLHDHRHDFIEESALDISLHSGFANGGSDIVEIENRILEDLERTCREEILLKRTVTGPHRDSFDFVLGEEPIRRRSSRGQLKNMVLRIKVAEYHLLKEELGRIPIVILDDVFAEMDASRRGNLAKLLEMGSQVFWGSTGLTAMCFGKGRRFVELDIVDGVVRSRREVKAAA